MYISRRRKNRLCTFDDAADKIAIFRIQICGPICLRHCGSQEARLFSTGLQKWLNSTPVQNTIVS